MKIEIVNLSVRLNDYTVRAMRAVFIGCLLAPVVIVVMALLWR